jgi:hypothetical protein
MFYRPDARARVRKLYVKTKKPYHRSYFYLVRSRRSGKKVTQSVVYVGRNLSLSSADWFALLARAVKFETDGFPPLSIRDVFLTVEKFMLKNDFPSSTMTGLKDAMKAAVHGAPAYRILGLRPGATVHEIRTAFRTLSRTHHPDVGGDSAKFQALVKARDELSNLGPTSSKTVPLHPRKTR